MKDEATADKETKLSDRQRAKLMKQIARLGEPRVRALLGLSYGTITRAAGGFVVRLGTITHIEHNMPKLEAALKEDSK